MADDTKSKKRTNSRQFANGITKSLKTSKIATPSSNHKETDSNQNLNDINSNEDSDSDSQSSCGTDCSCSCSDSCCSLLGSEDESHVEKERYVNENKASIKKAIATKVKQQPKAKTVSIKTTKTAVKRNGTADLKKLESANNLNKTKNPNDDKTGEPTTNKENETKPKIRPPPDENNASAIKLPVGIRFKKRKTFSSPDDSPKRSPKRSPKSFGDIPVIDSFEKMRIDSNLITGLRSLNVNKMNDLQKRLLPILLENRTEDIYLRTLPARGKKIAVLLSLMQRVNTGIHEPQVIYLTPTNDLTLELFETAKKIVQHSKIGVQALWRNMESQTRRINQQFIISPIGTLLYLIRERMLDVSNLRCLFFDEMDILLNSDANAQRIRGLIDYLKKPCQLIFHSSHVDKTPLNFVRNHFRRMPYVLDFLKNEDYFKNTLQFHITCKDNTEKNKSLFNILRMTTFTKTIIYCCGQNAAFALERVFRMHQPGYCIELLTTEVTLPKRIEIVSKLKTNQNVIIIANSPLLLGIDIGDQPVLIINFDLYKMGFGREYEYLSRLAHCLRYERPGIVVNFSLIDSLYCADDLQKYHNVKFLELDALGKLLAAKERESKENSLVEDTELDFVNSAAHLGERCSDERRSVERSSQESSSKEPNSKEPNSKEPNSKEPNSKEPNSKEPNSKEPSL